MRVFLALLAIASYGNLVFIAWSFFGLDRCGANDGCLGYVWNYWVGVCTGVLICIVGGATWAIAREKGIRTGHMSFAVCTLALTLTVLLSLTWLHKPNP